MLMRSYVRLHGDMKGDHSGELLGRRVHLFVRERE